jgi:hypothetical protein
MMMMIIIIIIIIIIMQAVECGDEPSGSCAT